MLKEAASPHVVRCHKMLKTSHNLYLVYDFMAASTLQNYFPDPSEAPLHLSTASLIQRNSSAPDLSLLCSTLNALESSTST